MTVELRPMDWLYHYFAMQRLKEMKKIAKAVDISKYMPTMDLSKQERNESLERIIEYYSKSTDISEKEKRKMIDVAKRSITMYGIVADKKIATMEPLPLLEISDDSTDDHDSKNLGDAKLDYISERMVSLAISDEEKPLRKRKERSANIGVIERPQSDKRNRDKSVKTEQIIQPSKLLKPIQSTKKSPISTIFNKDDKVFFIYSTDPKSSIKIDIVQINRRLNKTLDIMWNDDIDTYIFCSNMKPIILNLDKYGYIIGAQTGLIYQAGDTENQREWSIKGSVMQFSTKDKVFYSLMPGKNVKMPADISDSDDYDNLDDNYKEGLFYIFHNKFKYEYAQYTISAYDKLVLYGIDGRLYDTDDHKPLRVLDDDEPKDFYWFRGGTFKGK